MPASLTVMRAYESLKAWQLAHELAVEVALAVRRFPREDRYEIGAQLRRAATSVPTNIVEGKASFGLPNYLRHVRIALASAAEVEYLLRLAKDIGCLTEEESTRLRTQARSAEGLVYRLARSLERRVK
jgi:four helix bundle protein